MATTSGIEVARAGVVVSVDAGQQRLEFRSSGDLDTVTYTSRTRWSAGLEKILTAGWHVIVAGALDGSTIAARKIFNDPAPERAACKSDAMTVDIAVAAYEAVSGSVPPTVASLTSRKNGGPYLNRVPGGTFYRFALNWGGSPAKENGGKHPGELDVAPVWHGSVRAYVAYDTERATTGCNAAT